MHNFRIFYTKGGVAPEDFKDQVIGILQDIFGNFTIYGEFLRDLVAKGFNSKPDKINLIFTESQLVRMTHVCNPIFNYLVYDDDKGSGISNDPANFVANYIIMHNVERCLKRFDFTLYWYTSDDRLHNFPVSITCNLGDVPMDFMCNQLFCDIGGDYNGIFYVCPKLIRRFVCQRNPVVFEDRIRDFFYPSGRIKIATNVFVDEIVKQIRGRELVFLDIDGGSLRKMKEKGYHLSKSIGLPRIFKEIEGGGECPKWLRAYNIFSKYMSGYSDSYKYRIKPGDIISIFIFCRTPLFFRREIIEKIGKRMVSVHNFLVKHNEFSKSRLLENFKFADQKRHEGDNFETRVDFEWVDLVMKIYKEKCMREFLLDRRCEDYFQMSLAVEQFLNCNESYIEMLSSYYFKTEELRA